MWETKEMVNYKATGEGVRTPTFTWKTGSARRESTFTGFLGSAADEVDDFELIAIGEFRLRPALATHEFAIEFDRHAIGLHAEQRDQFRQSLDGAEFAVLTINLQRQV
jgi:hypothetical protein